jgi:hypothetical protein
METPLLRMAEFLFGCHHRLSRVFTICRRTHKVCLEYGREFEYSWELMHSKQAAVPGNVYAPLNATLKRARFDPVV